MSGAAVRAAAAEAVEAVVGGGRSLDAALDAAGRSLPAAERPLLHELAFGTLRHHWRLRAWVSALLERPVPRKDRVIESLLAVGLYQLAELRVPDHAAVTLTVEAARKLRRPRYAGVVNASLRNFRRRAVAASEPASDEERYNHPAWLIERLRQDWSEHWQRILEANGERAPMWLRVNRSRVSVEDYVETLRAGSGDESCETRGLPGFDQAFELRPPRPVARLPGFADGLVSVQDAAAQLAAPWLLLADRHGEGDGRDDGDGGGDGRGGDDGCGARPCGGEEDAVRILDACAAPGGKAAHLLELAGPGAELTALDRDPERLASVGENLRRLGLSATLVAGDASTPGEWWDGRPYQKILLDAPCSATGVVRRHPDIKLLRRASDIAALADLQRRLLEALWPLLAPGGRLLYVTCSVLAEENDQVVGSFLSCHGTAREDQLLPNYNIRDLMYRRATGFQILPGTAGLDGFYYACLEKTR